MNVEPDYEDILRLFNKYKVKYCIIGAFAIAFYARPRYSKDIDILVEPDLTNAQNIMKALKEFGFGSTGLSLEDFSKEGKVVQLGFEPVRIDIITSIGESKFKDIWKNKKIGRYGEQKVYIIGLNELINSKKSSNRKQDQADLEILILSKKK